MNLFEKKNMCNNPKFDFKSATNNIWDPSNSVFTLCSTEPTLGNPYLENLYGTTTFIVSKTEYYKNDQTKILVTVKSYDTNMYQNIIFPFKKNVSDQSWELNISENKIQKYTYKALKVDVNTEKGFSITRLPKINAQYNINLNYNECLINVEDLHKELTELTNTSSSGGKRKRKRRSRGRSKKYTKQGKTKRGKRERRKSY